MEKASLNKTLGLIVMVFYVLVFLKFAPNIVASNLHTEIVFSNRFQNFCLYTSTINTPFLHCKNILTEFDATYFLNSTQGEYKNCNFNNIENKFQSKSSDSKPINSKKTKTQSSGFKYWLALALILPFVVVLLILIVPQKPNSLIDSPCKREVNKKPPRCNDDDEVL